MVSVTAALLGSGKCPLGVGIGVSEFVTPVMRRKAHCDLLRYGLPYSQDKTRQVPELKLMLIFCLWWVWLCLVV